MTPSPAVPPCPRPQSRRRFPLTWGAWLMGLPLLWPSVALADAARPATPPPLAAGQYLYGQTSVANVPGVSYLVMQVSQQRVVGAFYQPSSSFDCVHGTATANQLALTVVDSYDQTTHPYALAMVAGTAIASTSPVHPGQLVHPQGFQPLATLSESDQAILRTCLANYSL